jgi:hypothetical protein
MDEIVAGWLQKFDGSPKAVHGFKSRFINLSKMRELSRLSWRTELTH